MRIAQSAINSLIVVGRPRLMTTTTNTNQRISNALTINRRISLSTSPASNNLNNNTRPSSSTSTSSGKRPRIDPTVKRPNKVCDPYGQGGKPLTLADAEIFKSAIDAQWEYEYMDQNNDDEIKNLNEQPIAIRREFIHPDYISGSKFIYKVACIAQLHNHYPSINLDRRIVNKNWQVVTTCRCDTQVLGGLSANDFQIATLIDVEVARTETQDLLLKIP